MAETGDDRGGGKEASEAFKSLLQRIGEIFGVFDLSFFVAGSVCFGAILFGVHVFQGQAWLYRLKPEAEDWRAVHLGAVVLASYVLGMVCFALGGVRRTWGSPPYLSLPQKLEDLGLERHYRHLLGQKPGLLYTRLWAELRQRRDLAPSFNLITRYWVMSAMCDGLAIAWAAWAVTWIAWAHAPPGICEPGPIYPLKLAVAASFLGAAALCWREASRYGEAQVQELAATLAYAYQASEEGKAEAAGASPVTLGGPERSPQTHPAIRRR